MATQVSIPIPWDKTVNYSGITNGGWEQKCDAHILWNGEVHTSIGKGEGTPTSPAIGSMDTGPKPVGGDKHCDVDITCSFRRSPDVPWEFSDVKGVKTTTDLLTRWTINAEDGFKTGKDKDFNDLEVTFEWLT